MKSYVVGNWKMNFTVGESSLYLHKLLKRLKPHRGLEIVAAPSTIALQPLSLQVDRKKLKLSAQNCFDRDYGAYTGEVSATQLRTLVDYCIIGHSERRYHFHESDKDIKNKVAACLRNNITPILCIGETASERDFGETKDVIKDQLLGGLSEVPEEDQAKVIIAYEPVWAISSVKGAKLASPTDVAEVINIIRDFIPKDAPLLFGGSVNPSNAGGYLTIPGINGLLVGGASLIADEFLSIIEVANRVKS
ncbi:MAG: triose-phosphate isomerase [Candidatus Saccharibacteria bacterium]|nr:triose-phosphate isomerase [Candidatus Saccharibacteria bacterium]